MENRRKRLYVPHEYQKRLVIIPVLVIIIAVNALIAIGLLLFDPLVSTYLTPGRVMILAALEAIVLVVLYKVTRFMSHTIAGPIHALMCRLDNLGEGDLVSQIEFRKRDFHHALAQCFNRNMAALCQHIITLKTLVQALKEADEGSQRTKLIEEIGEKISVLKTHRDELKAVSKAKDTGR